jgi:hypothetical protein
MQVRMADLHPGDIVNKNHDDSRGWFEVNEIHELPNSGIVVQAASEKDSINGGPYDIVGVQVTKAVEIPNQIRAA